MQKKRVPTLAELIEALSPTAPNPFVLACMEEIMKAKPVVEAVPPLHRVDDHAACIAAVMMLQAEPTPDNLNHLRAALTAYIEEDFCN